MIIKSDSKNLFDKVRKYIVDRKITSISSKDDDGNPYLWVCDLSQNHEQWLLESMTENLNLKRYD
jgi:hypothetical protein